MDPSLEREFERIEETCAGAGTLERSGEFNLHGWQMWQYHFVDFDSFKQITLENTVTGKRRKFRLDKDKAGARWEEV